MFLGIGIYWFVSFVPLWGTLLLLGTCMLLMLRRGYLCQWTCLRYESGCSSFFSFAAPAGNRAGCPSLWPGGGRSPGSSLHFCGQLRVEQEGLLFLVTAKQIWALCTWSLLALHEGGGGLILSGPQYKS